MRAQRAFGRLLSVLTVGTAVLLSLLQVPVVGVVVFSLLGLVLGTWLGTHPVVKAALGAHGVTTPVGRTACTGVAVPCVAGVAATFGVTGLGLWVLALVGATWLLGFPQAGAPGGAPASAPLTTRAPAPPLREKASGARVLPASCVVGGVEERGTGDLSDAELCWVWRNSFLRVQQARSVEHLDAIYRARWDYLQELERRDPEGFAAWLASGARADSDPGRYLRLDP